MVLMVVGSGGTSGRGVLLWEKRAIFNYSAFHINRPLVSKNIDKA